MISKLKQDLKELEDKDKAKLYQGFFKTGKGQYGEGDIFLGITVPNQRKVAKKYKDLTLQHIQELLNSNIHEHRFTALVILTNQYKNNKEQIKDFYLKNAKRINNWDLVDTTAHKILGDYLHDKDKSILYKLANSENLWEKRIAIISTAHFISKNKFEDTLKISEILLKDKHDLIHKAVGWMLREVGKRDLETEEQFLRKHYKDMPRTMLRYAIEKFEETKRQAYLKGNIPQQQTI